MPNASQILDGLGHFASILTIVEKLSNDQDTPIFYLSQIESWLTLSKASVEDAQHVGSRDKLRLWAPVGV